MRSAFFLPLRFLLAVARAKQTESNPFAADPFAAAASQATPSVDMFGSPSSFAGSPIPHELESASRKTIRKGPPHPVLPPPSDLASSAATRIQPGAVIGGTNATYGLGGMPATTREAGIPVDPSIYDDHDEKFDNEAEAQHLLDGNAEGTFCVRSSGSEPNCVVVTTICNSQVIHVVMPHTAGVGLIYDGRTIGVDIEACIQTFRSKTPLVAPDGTNFWLKERTGPEKTKGKMPAKGTKEWKDMERNRKKEDKETQKRLKADAKAQEKKIKQMKKIQKQAVKNGVPPPTSPEPNAFDVDYGETFDSPQFGDTAPPAPFTAPASLPALPQLPGAPSPSSPPPLPPVPAAIPADSLGAVPAPSADPFGALPLPAVPVQAADPFGALPLPAVPVQAADPFGAPPLPATPAPAAAADPFGALPLPAVPLPAAAADPFGALPLPAAPAPAPALSADPFGAPPPAAAGGSVDPFGAPEAPTSPFGEVATQPSLELSESEQPIYAKIWADLANGKATIMADVVVPFLTQSKADLDTLKDIWELADVETPLGELSESEFYSALKLVALFQAGMEVKLANIGLSTPPPTFEPPPSPPPATEAVPAPVEEEAAAATTVGTSEPQEVPAACTKFAISVTDLQWYEQLWGEAPTTSGDVLPAGGALKFFTTSTLAMGDLKMIWGASDTTAPKGQLSKEEFFGALKLIAVKQNGGALNPAAFALPGQPLPRLGANDPPEQGAAPASVEPPAAAAVPAPAPVPASATENGGEELPAIAVKLALSADDLQVYSALWAEAPTAAGEMLPAGGALKFFTTSGLGTADLKMIWGASDTTAPKGQLSKDEFFGALKLIAVKQNGGALNPAAFALAGQPLPKVGATVAAVGGGGGDGAAAATAEGDLPAIATTLALSKDDVAFYDDLWSKAPTDSGFLAAGGAVKFLGYSKLPMDDLKAIWSLSDKIAPKGKLCKDEFFAACKYVAIKQNGGDLNAGGVLTATTPLPKFG